MFRTKEEVYELAVDTGVLVPGVSHVTPSLDALVKFVERVRDAAWISVKEQSPEDKGFDSDGDPVTAVMTYPNFRTLHYADGKWWDLDYSVSDYWTLTAAPRYWTLLPKPPITDRA